MPYEEVTLADRRAGLVAGLRPHYQPLVSPPPQEHPWRTAGRTVFVGDEEFVVREAGPDGAPMLLLIHGLAGSSLAEWYRIGPGLAEKYRVIMVDHRSHGLAPLARDRFEVEDLADDMAGVLDALGVGRLSVVGYSMGGAIAQAFARRHPHRVDRLMLIATFSHHPQPHRAFRAIGAVLARGGERFTGLGTPRGQVLLSPLDRGRRGASCPLALGGDPPPGCRRRRPGDPGSPPVRLPPVDRQDRG